MAGSGRGDVFLAWISIQKSAWGVDVWLAYISKQVAGVETYGYNLQYISRQPARGGDR
jgi:hypothetical protein